jgi:tryptophan halogenase
MIKELCILGGGTSGLVCALIQRATYPNLKIKIIESASIGIIGVGEGSTEHWRTFMERTGISIFELITEAGATFKSGIMFTNWNGDGKRYFHTLNGSFLAINYSGLSSTYLHAIANGATPLELMPSNLIDSMHYEPYEMSVNQFHFDTFKLNNFLHKKCIERNIEIIQRDIVDISLDQDGYVDALVDNDNQQIKSDFFIDCSGFKRVILSKLGAKWISCAKQLPMNSAIAFPTEYQEEIPSYTNSTAVSSGWMWRIPTQERFGNGYVFCDEFISEDAAIAEAQSFFDKPINVGRRFKFDAGYVDQFWIKNCVALGLSGSFVEPLEATSIGTSIQQSFGLVPLLQSWTRGETISAKAYNSQFRDVITNIVDFVQLHYITKRNDTEFWKWINHNIELTEFNQETLDKFKNSFPTNIFFSSCQYKLFNMQNWILVMHGLEMFNIEKIKELVSVQEPGAMVNAGQILNDMDNFIKNTPPTAHREVLKILSTRPGVHIQTFD